MFRNDIGTNFENHEKSYFFMVLEKFRKMLDFQKIYNLDIRNHICYRLEKLKIIVSNVLKHSKTMKTCIKMFRNNIGTNFENHEKS